MWFCLAFWVRLLLGVCFLSHFWISDSRLIHMQVWTQAGILHRPLPHNPVFFLPPLPQSSWRPCVYCTCNVSSRSGATYLWFQMRWNKCFSWRGKGESYLLPLREVIEYRGSASLPYSLSPSPLCYIQLWYSSWRSSTCSVSVIEKVRSWSNIDTH